MSPTPTAPGPSLPPPELAGSSLPVSRFDIAEFVGDVFGETPVQPALLAYAASTRGALPAVVLQLRRLPDRHYHDLHDLWLALADLPDVFDPWEASSS